MEYVSSILVVITGLAGLIVGYTLGYRTGRISGELAVLKELQRERRRHGLSRSLSHRRDRHGTVDHNESVD